MTRECHVRFCERLPGKFLWPTHHFGMKVHVGVDSNTKMIHSVVVATAKTADSTVVDQLLHGKETRVYGDQAYQGKRAAIRAKSPKAKDFTNKRCKWKGIVDQKIADRN